MKMSELEASVNALWMIAIICITIILMTGLISITIFSVSSKAFLLKEQDAFMKAKYSLKYDIFNSSHRYWIAPQDIEETLLKDFED